MSAREAICKHAMATQAWLKTAVSAEELADLVDGNPRILRLKEDSPLYEDMAEILARSERGETWLHTHAEVWDE
jgi:hypothetical protein